MASTPIPAADTKTDAMQDNANAEDTANRPAIPGDLQPHARKVGVKWHPYDDPNAVGYLGWWTCCSTNSVLGFTKLDGVFVHGKHANPKPDTK